MKASWVSAMFNAQTQIASGISRIKVPFITLHGTDDQLVDMASSQFLFNNAKSEDKTFEVCHKCILHTCIVNFHIHAAFHTMFY